MNSRQDQQTHNDASTSTASLSLFVSRYYWVQIALIALAVIFGVLSSAVIMKGLLLKAAMEQEAEHYWQRYEKNNQAPLPDTKNLYGYIWAGEKPNVLKKYKFKDKGVSSLFVDGKKRTVIYDEHEDKRLLLVFGESNVNRIVWLFGVTPLALSLMLLYSILWFFNKKAQSLVSPVERLAKAIHNLDLNSSELEDKPFDSIDTKANIEAQNLKVALSNYHQTLINFIRREQLFTREVSHELRTPLSVIKGSLQVLEAQSAEIAQSNSVVRMHNTINDMQLIIDTLLAIAREGSNKIELNEQELRPILDHVSNDLKRLSERHGMVVNIIQKEACLTVTNDTIAYMVFSNIVRNALNYSQGKFVTIILSQDTVEIIDDGVGLPASILKGLQKNGEANQFKEVPVQGNGIGLKLVKRLCKLLKWSLEIESVYKRYDNLKNSSGLHVTVRLS